MKILSYLSYMPAVLCVAVMIAFAASPDPIDNVPPTGYLVAVHALPDKTAVLGWARSQGSFLSRVRGDGTAMWVQALAGRIHDDTLVINEHDIAVPFQRGTSVGLAIYSTEGDLRWQRVLREVGNVRDAEAGAELVTTVFIGDSLVVRYFVDQHQHMIVLRRTDGQVGWDHQVDVEGGIIPLGSARFILRGVFETREYDLRSGDSHSVGDGCVIGDRFVTAHEIGGADIRACGRYRDRDAWVVETATGTMLLEKTSDGSTVLQHALPSVQPIEVHDLFGFPWASAGFTGTLPRFVPLVAGEGERERAILVDLETGEIVGRSDVDNNVMVFRDGETSYVLYDVTRGVAAFDPTTHVLGPFRANASVGGGIRPAQISAGMVWIYSSDDTHIDAPSLHPVSLLK